MLSALGWLLAAATIAGALIASCHAILYKRDTRATVLWVSFIMLAPVAGPICYLLLGINRIKRRASMLRRSAPRHDRSGRWNSSTWASVDRQSLPPVVEQRANFARLARLIETVVELPALPGNRVVPLFNGVEAFPAMIAAIDAAEHSIGMCTYIFDHDASGIRFADALGRAVERGVDVRVLVDDTGLRYSFPTVVRALRKRKIRVARFLPTLAPHKAFALNMRNHRKLLIVDGRSAFSGGINIRGGNEADAEGNVSILDMHFKIEGPVVEHMRDVFADDWIFTTGERLEGNGWHPALDPVGEVYARGIADGPDEDLDRLRWVLLGGLASAHERVCIATPYFLPDPGLISALNTAALRGVSVEILLPKTNNLPVVQWASIAHWWQVLERGCRVFVCPGAFDHSKVMTVDGEWSLIGSANWDPRSLRLNFEFNLECYCPTLAATLEQWFDAKRALSHEVTIEEVNARNLAVRLRDGVARLATPFL